MINIISLVSTRVSLSSIAEFIRKITFSPLLPASLLVPDTDPLSKTLSFNDGPERDLFDEVSCGSGEAALLAPASALDPLGYCSGTSMYFFFPPQGFGRC